MSVPSMVHRSGDTLVVRSLVSGETLYGCTDDALLLDDDDDDDAAAGGGAAGDDAKDALRPCDDDAAAALVDLPECKVKRNYSCGRCEFFTQNPRSFLYHSRNVHNEKLKIFECPNCLYASKHFQKLLRHTKMVHGTTTPPTTTSASSVTRKRAATVEEPPSAPPTLQPAVTDSDDEHHMLVVVKDECCDDEDIDHLEENSMSPPPLLLPQQQQQQQHSSAGGVHKCSVCAFVAKSPAQLAKHEREEHIKTKFFRCTKCTYVTHMKARFTKHVKYHSMPMIKCSMCDFRTPYKWNLDRHRKNHNGRGAFRCSACNFTADIKQSLTVHEMNHHVPPVGQAAGLGVGRRRNKVGASDSTAVELQQLQTSTTALSCDETADGHTKCPDHVTHSSEVSTPTTTTTSSRSSSISSSPEFAHPDDIALPSNGKVSGARSKCRFCAFKTSCEHEMLRHESDAHADLMLTPPVKRKCARPVPDLLPIGQHHHQHLAAKATAASSSLSAGAIMSQTDMNKILASSKNSALKDFAKLFGGEDAMFQDSAPTAPKSFFDQFKDKLYEAESLVCEHCGKESKCLTEHTMHKNACGRLWVPQVNITHISKLGSTRCQHCRQRCKSSKDLYNHMQTCAAAAAATFKDVKVKQEEPDADAGYEQTRVKVEELGKQPHPMENKVFIWTKMEQEELDEKKQQQHHQQLVYDAYESGSAGMMLSHPHDGGEMNSLDWSIRTQSPNSESNSSLTNNNNNNSSVNNNNNSITFDMAKLYSSTLPPPPPPPPPTSTAAIATTTPDKIPTHGNDISVAQHKRVFKCPHCTFWASTASRFHVHIVGHLNKKPFECSLCSYRSNWRWDITKHIKLKSVRDPQHESARVLMTDETGRRNYTKYNKYLTEIHVNGGADGQETSGGMGTRPKDKAKSGNVSMAAAATNSNLRPPPQLKPAEEFMNKMVSAATTPVLASSPDKKKASPTSTAAGGDHKKSYWQCKKCSFRDLCREKCLSHVRSHYSQPTSESGCNDHGDGHNGGADGDSFVGGFGASDGSNQLHLQSDVETEASVIGGVARGQAPFRCGHCDQVSNWKHVIQRHCRLKHAGDIKVIISANGSGAAAAQHSKEAHDFGDMIGGDDAIEPNDVVQDGSLKCSHCPFSSNDAEVYHMHLEGHIPNANATIKCNFCNYYVAHRDQLASHLKLHGVHSASLVEKLGDGAHLEQAAISSKRYKCTTCPYVTNSKSQFTYHKQFHKPKNGQYSCSECSYNVSKRHLLHQHMKVHGITVLPQKQNGEAMDLDDICDEIEEVHSPTFDWQNLAEIPLVWVSKGGKFSKMYRCRFCPHVNLRKVNILEHEKMHRSRSATSSTRVGSEHEHRCPDCNYVCNNAGVLSSHNKVHQGVYFAVHGLVDLSKTDEEQMREMGAGSAMSLEDEQPDGEGQQQDELLHFCSKCPARFLKESEFGIHAKFHGADYQYRCEHCSYLAQQKQYLLVHAKVHTKDYQERTKTLIETYRISAENPPPEVTAVGDVWIAENALSSDEEDEQEDEDAVEHSSPAYKRSMNVPLSGTELFLQKSEAEAQETGVPTKIKPVREKRHKCPKCPSSFEKREQFKHHLGLHGSKQQYVCGSCDYSVSSFTNLQQHEKKHLLQVRSLEDDMEEVDVSAASFKDQQQQQQQATVTTTENVRKPVFWCTMCPYTNSRRDAVDNHQKRHVKLSGIESNYMCSHCDYSVPQQHFLRDHTKLHFSPNKMHTADGYAAQKVVQYNIKSEDATDDEERLYCVGNEDDNDVSMADAKASLLNNNEGEKVFVNMQTGEVMAVKKEPVEEKEVEANAKCK